jgi:WG containing repeat
MRRVIVVPAAAIWGAIVVTVLSSSLNSQDQGPNMWAKDPASSNAVFKAGYDGGGTIIDASGKVLAQLGIDWMPGDFYEGVAAVWASGGNGFLRPNGTWESPPKFFRSRDFSDGLAQVMLGTSDLWGYIDHSGKVVIEPHFQLCGRFRSGLAAATLEGTTWGYIDHSGNFSIKRQFLYAGDFAEGRARVVLSKSPCKMITTKAQDYAGWHDLPDLPLQPSPPTAECRVSFIDDRGKMITGDTFEAADDFSQGLAPVLSGGKWGFLDLEGRLAIRFQFDDVRGFSEGLAAVRAGKRWGYIDRNGRLMIPPTYWTATAFSEGLAAVGVRPALIYINKKNETVLPGPYDGATPFAFGLAHVETHDKNGPLRMYIDHSGKSVYAYRRENK